MSIITDFEGFIERFLKWLKGLKPEVHKILVDADAILNKLKSWEEGTPLGQFFENEIEPLIPGLGIALQNYFAEAFKLLKWAEDLTAVGDVVVAQGLAYLKNIPDGPVRIAQHNTAAALIGHFASSNKGQLITMQQHLILPQVVHNPEILDDLAA